MDTTLTMTRAQLLALINELTELLAEAQSVTEQHHITMMLTKYYAQLKRAK